MLTSLHAAALMTYQAAARLDAGPARSRREAAMTKLFASETAVRITDEAARIFASYGLAMEYPVQRYFRDARFLLPGGGTSEILRVVIGASSTGTGACLRSSAERVSGFQAALTGRAGTSSRPRTG